ncbi:hypothetical protein AVEN_125757-1 [Araneus ventricosus]|uniref:Uncharacterized protein n=1 Tax=Araneus ventricosus TaxID=182803 RepID=A0A4Y2A9M6_ARAVE|nr:hypothetical protein AVEN_125757-1 [Araneus ventricosus]
MYINEHTATINLHLNIPYYTPSHTPHIPQLSEPPHGHVTDITFHDHPDPRFTPLRHQGSTVHAVAHTRRIHGSCPLPATRITVRRAHTAGSPGSPVAAPDPRFTHCHATGSIGSHPLPTPPGSRIRASITHATRIHAVHAPSNCHCRIHGHAVIAHPQDPRFTPIHCPPPGSAVRPSIATPPGSWFTPVRCPRRRITVPRTIIATPAKITVLHPLPAPRSGSPISTHTPPDHSSRPSLPTADHSSPASITHQDRRYTYIIIAHTKTDRYLMHPSTHNN